MAVTPSRSDPTERFYSPDDVTRWEIRNAESIALHRQRLSEPQLPDRQQDFHLGILSLAYHSQGMLCIAKNRFDDAIQSFRASVEAKCRMYERFAAGVGRPLEAGHFQSVLIALVTRDETLVGEIGRRYNTDVGTPDSIFLGSALQCLVLGDHAGARSLLDRKRPRFERQFVGYAECLHAIAIANDQQFAAALTLASESWMKWAARVVKGLPDSVCFIHGVGFVRLAEKLFGRRVPVSNVSIPPPLVE